ncbi:hypothetical protein [Sunxiuqinia sp. sy24]|uniref:hypothetical protein n=1 Tax=Sunxiuqinia sp. sy24 TaxID=3461495 RepID=UPI004045A2E3
MKKSFTLSYFIHDFTIDGFAPREMTTNSLMGSDELQPVNEQSFTPSEKSVQKVLNFSRSYDVLNSCLMTNIEFIKN